MQRKFNYSVLVAVLLVVTSLLMFSSALDESEAGIPPTPAFKTIIANGTSVIADSASDILDFDSDDSILITGLDTVGGVDSFSANWNNKKLITIDNTKVGGDLVNFPVLVSFTDTDLRDNALPNGNDIVFVHIDGTTQLSHEIEHYDSVTGELQAWVKMDVSGSVDTQFYMYYGNSGAVNSEDNCNVWGDTYHFVYHLHDDFNDSACNVNATNSGSTDAQGKIADGQDFDGISDYINQGDPTEYNSGNLTFSGWINSDSLTSDQALHGRWSITASQKSHILWLDDVAGGTGRVNTYSCIVANSPFGSTTVITYGATNAAIQDQWQYVACTVEMGSATGLNLYIDGQLDANSPESLTAFSALNDSPLDVYFGNEPANSRLVDGGLDEIRVANVALSGEWLLTEWNNQNDPSTFYAVGTQQTINALDSIFLELNSPTTTRLGGVYADDCSPNAITSINNNGTVNCGTSQVDATIPKVIKYYDLAVSSSTNIPINNIPPYEFLDVFVNAVHTTGWASIHEITFNNDTGNNYAWRTTDNTNKIQMDSTGSTDDRFYRMTINNNPNHNKIGFSDGTKYVNSNADIQPSTGFDFIYNGTGMIQSILIHDSSGANPFDEDYTYVTIIGWNSTG